MLTGPAELMIGVGSETPGAEPSGVFAVTRTRIVPPTSPAASWYVPDVAPPIALQPVPAEPHRCHSYEYDVIPLSDVQEPTPAESSVPSEYTPPAAGATVGREVLATARPHDGSDAPSASG